VSKWKKVPEFLAALVKFVSSSRLRRHVESWVVEVFSDLGVFAGEFFSENFDF